ncbi:hypothetical protein ARMGADRAFT_1032606 [Armillaria gallica]|uniref:Uncharacterized protein n=1 Tax=Armillaria gallica TaxID=47427 RepID=A0A2H3DP04_ARMGA|nr:hypothetical protein ARMGADRAFT_1032606 [Armillaria gallica]
MFAEGMAVQPSSIPSKYIVILAIFSEADALRRAASLLTKEYIVHRPLSYTIASAYFSFAQSIAVDIEGTASWRICLGTRRGLMREHLLRMRGGCAEIEITCQCHTIRADIRADIHLYTSRHAGRRLRRLRHSASSTTARGGVASMVLFLSGTKAPKPSVVEQALREDNMADGAGPTTVFPPPCLWVHRPRQTAFVVRAGIVRRGYVSTSGEQGLGVVEVVKSVGSTASDVRLQDSQRITSLTTCDTGRQFLRRHDVSTSGEQGHDVVKELRHYVSTSGEHDVVEAYGIRVKWGRWTDASSTSIKVRNIDDVAEEVGNRQLVCIPRFLKSISWSGTAHAFSHPRFPPFEDDSGLIDDVGCSTRFAFLGHVRAPVERWIDFNGRLRLAAARTGGHPSRFMDSERFEPDDNPAHKSIDDEKRDGELPGEHLLRYLQTLLAWFDSLDTLASTVAERVEDEGLPTLRIVYSYQPTSGSLAPRSAKPLQMYSPTRSIQFLLEQEDYDPQTMEEKPRAWSDEQLQDIYEAVEKLFPQPGKKRQSFIGGVHSEALLMDYLAETMWIHLDQDNMYGFKESNKIVALPLHHQTCHCCSFLYSFLFCKTVHPWNVRNRRFPGRLIPWTPPRLWHNTDAFRALYGHLLEMIETALNSTVRSKTPTMEIFRLGEVLNQSLGGILRET